MLQRRGAANKPMKLPVPPQGHRSTIGRPTSAVGPQLIGKPLDGQMRQRLLHGATLGGRVGMALAVLWLVFGYVAPSTGPGSESKATGRNLSNMDFAGLVWMFVCGVALVAASVLIGLVVARLWPTRPGTPDDE